MIFGVHDDFAIGRRVRRAARARATMCRGAVVDQRVGGVEPQAVDVVFADPVQRVLDDERGGPSRCRGRRDSRRRPTASRDGRSGSRDSTRARYAPFRAEMVVDHVEEDGESEVVRLRRRAGAGRPGGRRPRRREQRRRRRSPSSARPRRRRPASARSRSRPDRAAAAGIAPRRRRCPRARTCRRAARRWTRSLRAAPAPRRVGPRERGGIDDLRTARARRQAESATPGSGRGSPPSSVKR